MSKFRFYQKTWVRDYYNVEAEGETSVGYNKPI